MSEVYVKIYTRMPDTRLKDAGAGVPGPCLVPMSASLIEGPAVPPHLTHLYTVPCKMLI